MKHFTVNIRSFLRSNGILPVLKKIIRAPRLIARSYYKIQYSFTRPEGVSISTIGDPAFIRVRNANEYALIRLQYEKKVQKFFKKNIRQGDIVWDIGAHIGIYSSIFGKAVGGKGKVFCFEPNPVLKKLFEKNISFNNLKNVEYVPIAIAGEEGTIEFQTDSEYDSVGRIIDQKCGCDGKWATIKVEVSRGDAWVQKTGHPIPCIIKMDIEGFEDDALSGMQKILSNSICRAIVIEVHFGFLEARGRKFAPVEIVGLLKTNGFTSIRWLDHSHLAALKNN